MKSGAVIPILIESISKFYWLTEMDLFARGQLSKAALIKNGVLFLNSLLSFWTWGCSMIASPIWPGKNAWLSQCPPMLVAAILWDLYLKCVRHHDVDAARVKICALHIYGKTQHELI